MPNLLSIKNLSPNPSKEIVKRDIKNKKDFFNREEKLSCLINWILLINPNKDRVEKAKNTNTSEKINSNENLLFKKT